MHLRHARRSATPVPPQLWPIYQRPEPAGPSGPSRGLALESFQLPTNASELIDQVPSDPSEASRETLQHCLTRTVHD